MSINSHFRREGQLAIGFFVLLVLIGLVAAIVMPNVLGWRAEKLCREAKGTYDRDQDKCITNPTKLGGT